MKSLKVTGLMFGALMFVAANAFADDLDVTMDVMDMSDHAVENLMNPIDLPEQASDKAHQIHEDSEHGLKTANEARARAAERIGSSDHSEDISENAKDAADAAGDNASDAADDAADNASDAADDAADNAGEAADTAADNASAAAAAAADNASEVASQVRDNAGQ